MEIKTKFAPGDKLWAVKKKRVVAFIVKAISVNTKSIWYLSEDYEVYPEDEVFPSGEDLIETMKKGVEDCK